MVSSTRRTIAGILVIFCAAVFARAQAVQQKEPTATITGKITFKGKGAPGIFVGVRRNHNHTRELTRFKAVSDSEGKYRIENVPAGSYFVTPVAPAYVWDEADMGKALNVNKGETVENVDFTLTLGGAITGRVTDAEGRVQIEESVFLVPEPGNVRAQWRYLRGRTDDRGIYRIFGIPRGRYRVGAGNDSNHSRNQRISYQKTFYPGVADVNQATIVEVSEGSEAINIDITLSATLNTYRASGRIVDGQTNEPVPNVTYYVTHYFDKNGWSSTSSRVPTNSAGEFLVEDLMPGKYSVSARFGDWRTEEVPFEVLDQDVTGLVLRTEKAASISGVVVLEGTEDKGAREQLPMLTLHVSVDSEGSRGRHGGSLTPGPDGSFRLTGLAGGMASFGTSSPTQFRIARVERNGLVQPRGFEIKPGEQVSGVRIVVNYANASLRGAIVIENGPIPAGATLIVWLRKLGEDPSVPTAGFRTMLQLDARNQFISENLVPGTYEVLAGLHMRAERRSGPTKKQEVIVTAGSPTNVTITLDLSALTPKP